MPQTTVPYREEFDFDLDAGIFRFVCNTCGADVSNTPCPTHAPVNVPGLRLVDCTAEPRHMLWVHDREDYGASCPECSCSEYVQQKLASTRCRHWRWRSWRVTQRLVVLLRKTGLIRGWMSTWGNGHDGCVSIYWRWYRFPACPAYRLRQSEPR